MTRRPVTKAEALYMLLMHAKSIHRVAQIQLKYKGRDAALNGYASMILGDCVAIGRWAKRLGIKPTRRQS